MIYKHTQNIFIPSLKQDKPSKCTTVNNYSDEICHIH
uniref:Uncharacterized protein n=1 Tax=Anguilla anguilla TaxID=7936 RepID=A0A0E9USL2_ANGAN